MVYQEFTKLATQPKSENPTQQDKVKAFLNNLRRAVRIKLYNYYEILFT